ncbi:disks large 4 isoform X4 [Vespula squamosa]|uniref:Disks large 4 isoform X4 n=1 Tax=Vespula squamosa TaxID=30214 RepID=A0ABD2C7D8_VESSQ
MNKDKEIEKKKEIEKEKFGTVKIFLLKLLYQRCVRNASSNIARTCRIFVKVDGRRGVVERDGRGGGKDRRWPKLKDGPASAFPLTQTLLNIYGRRSSRPDVPGPIDENQG